MAEDLRKRLCDPLVDSNDKDQNNNVENIASRLVENVQNWSHNAINLLSSAFDNACEKQKQSSTATPSEHCHEARRILKKTTMMSPKARPQQSGPRINGTI
jgi:hypothetical protein